MNSGKPNRRSVEPKRQNITKVLHAAYELFTLHGIQYVTQNEICQASGISRPTLNRYFANKLELVLQTAEYIWENVDRRRGLSADILTDGKHSGLELLEIYMRSVRESFLKEPHLFMMCAEFAMYVFRAGPFVDDDMKERIACLTGERPILHRIYELAMKDGSIRLLHGIKDEISYFCAAYYGFLTYLGLCRQYEANAEEQTERYIQQTLNQYSCQRQMKA